MPLSHQQSVLCVEDDTDSWELFGFALSEFRLVFAETGAEAMKLASVEKFDLFLLDVCLPDGSGIELCRELKAFSPQTPVIFCSGMAREQDRRQGLDAGANAYLVKPLNYDLMKEVIQSLLSRQVA
jgi:DNA-binding response OmpR family regulator